MRKIIHKLFWAWDFDKEEKWLNEMSAKGLRLVSVGFNKYEFELCTPGEYAVRLEFLDHWPSNPESEQYIKFIEDSGAKQVGSYGRWVYFQKNTSDGDFELFSDNGSKIKHLKRILIFIGALGLLNLYLAAYNLWFFYSYESYANLIGIPNILVFLLAAFGFWRLFRKMRRLEKERRIFE